jgi:nucleotide-binding universal stress UspA family protein
VGSIGAAGGGDGSLCALLQRSSAVSGATAAAAAAAPFSLFDGGCGGGLHFVMAPAQEDEAAAGRRLTDVAAWLKRHGILAETLVAPSTGDDVAALAAVARAQHADVVVAGAYGHGRLREWAFGGVTADLLLDPVRCTMLSH